ncbi:hypothetical protein BG005_005767, partial [Podila minutissima]
MEIAQSVPDLVRGARAAYKKICKYYAKTDLTPIYSVATVLHPACRFEYWENEGWGEYTEEAKKAVRDVWKAHYKPQQSANPVQPTLSSSSGNLNQALVRLHKSRTPTVVNRDELEAFARAGLDF